MSLFVALWLGKVYNGGQVTPFPLNDTLGGLSAWESWSSGRFGVFWSGDNDISGNWGGGELNEFAQCLLLHGMVL